MMAYLVTRPKLDTVMEADLLCKASQEGSNGY